MESKKKVDREQANRRKIYPRLVQWWLLIGVVMVCVGFTRKSSESPRAVAKRRAASRTTDGGQWSGYALGR